MTIDSYSFSDIGGREENQDALGMQVDGDRGIFVLADGLGGHQKGRLASDCAISSLLEYWREKNLTGQGEVSEEVPAGDSEVIPAGIPEAIAEVHSDVKPGDYQKKISVADGVLKKENPADSESQEDRLQAGIKKANEAILSMQQEQSCNAKSTVVALTINGDGAVWAHSGDSRLYYLHDGRIAAVTQDHSVAYKKYQAGEITKEEIATDEDQSSLLRTLGGASRWEPEMSGTEELTREDGFLLCSDGAWEYIQDDEILVDYLKAGSAKEWAVLMLLRISARIPEDSDNLSLITVMLK